MSKKEIDDFLEGFVKDRSLMGKIQEIDWSQVKMEYVEKNLSSFVIIFIYCS